MDLIDGDDQLYGFIKEIYGICHTEVVIDDRTGQIIEKYSKEYEDLK